MPTENKIRYFFGTNSAEGFFAFREEYLPPAERRRVCILKGGPGTGKSGLMKKVAALGEAAGFVCEYYHCASDPESLDGIVFPEKGTAVVDGTSPHVIEAGCAGAVEDYISFSPYWDSEGIAAHRGEIETETGAMRQEFTAAYRYLRAAAELAANILDTSLSAVTREQLHRRGRALARRYIPAEKKPGGRVVRRFLGGITPAGRVFFGDTVSALCDRVVVLLTRERSYRKEPDKTLPVIARTFRKYPAFVETMRRRVDAYNANREALFALEAEGKVLVIAPEDTLGCSRTERDAEVLRGLWQQGYFIGRQAAESVRSLWTE